MGFAEVSCPGGQKGSSWKMLFVLQALFSCEAQPPGGKREKPGCRAQVGGREMAETKGKGNQESK